MGPQLSTLLRKATALTSITVLPLAISPYATANDLSFIEKVTKQFQESDFVFETADSNVPFPPVATFAISSYNGVAFNEQNPDAAKADILRVSQGAFYPKLLDRSNALLVGEYLNWSEFDTDTPDESSFDVSSLSFPVAWLRQKSPRIQQAAFIMPTAHHSSLDSGNWSWQLQGGVFAKRVQSEKLWWAYGLFVDLSPNEDYFLPYLGASWAVSSEWTISAIMPWPTISYAPSEDFLVRLGVSPSGASWNVDRDEGDVSFNLSKWDFGFTAEHRIKAALWASVETGVSGLGTFTFKSGGDLESPQTKLDSSWYLRFAIRLRP